MPGVQSIRETALIFIRFRYFDTYMGLIETVTETLKASTQSTNQSGDMVDNSKGAYWCTDCSERIRDVDVEGETPPACPECGQQMTFERSSDTTGCAC
jgi:Zn finger protein HypA/HybF involved in hydrogenase expression